MTKNSAHHAIAIRCNTAFHRDFGVIMSCSFKSFFISSRRYFQVLILEDYEVTMSQQGLKSFHKISTVLDEKLRKTLNKPFTEKPRKTWLSCVQIQVFL